MSVEGGGGGQGNPLAIKELNMHLQPDSYNVFWVGAACSLVTTETFPTMLGFM